MTRTASLVPSLAGAVALAMAAGAAWLWRRQVLSVPPPQLPRESAAQAQTRYPLPGEDLEPPRLSREALMTVIEANPFSAQRRAKPSAGGAAGGGPDQGQVAAPPQFVYKGQVQLGTRRRAILEEVTSKKTHFLEVGQSVAGFKLLDILDDRVLLSEPQTSQEVVVFLSSKQRP